MVKTRGKITQLLTPDDANVSTAAALLDAIYFKWVWVIEFPKYHT